MEDVTQGVVVVMSVAGFVCFILILLSCAMHCFQQVWCVINVLIDLHVLCARGMFASRVLRLLPTLGLQCLRSGYVLGRRSECG